MRNDGTRADGHRGRRAILELLKQEGPKDARTLGERLGVSAMAVRQHLYELQAEKLVDYVEESRPVGRPAKLWRLTPAADRFFPDGHAELTASLLEAMRATFGAPGVDRLLQTRAQQQARDYAAGIERRWPLSRRLQALAEMRTGEGYMAAVETEASGDFLLLENHCPICAAARACSGLCAAELQVFRSVLGDDVEVERIDHLLAGARRCAYRVRRRPA